MTIDEDKNEDKNEEETEDEDSEEDDEDSDHEDIFSGLACSCYLIDGLQKLLLFFLHKIQNQRDKSGGKLSLSYTFLL